MWMLILSSTAIVDTSVHKRSETNHTEESSDYLFLFMIDFSPVSVKVFASVVPELHLK